MFRAGRLTKRILIEALVVSLDSDGDQVETWYPLAPQLLSAEVSPLSGREIIAAAAVQSKVTTRIVIRFRPGIKASMRATHRGTIYNIEAVIPDNASGKRWLTLLCSSGVNEG